MGRRKDGGQAAAELALVLPVLALIALGCLDLGRAFSVWVTLTNATREGARYGCLHPADSAGIVARTEAEMAAAGLPSDALTVSVTPGAEGGPPVVVTARYDLQMLTTCLFGAGPRPIQARTQMAILPGGGS